MAHLAMVLGVALWIGNWLLVLAFSAVTPSYQLLTLFMTAAVLVCFGMATPTFISYMRACETKMRFWRAVRVIAFGLVTAVALGHVLYYAVWILDQDAFVDLSPADTPRYAAWRLFLFSWNNTPRLGTGVGWLLPLSHTARTITWIHDVYISIVFLMGIGSLAGQMSAVGCPPPRCKERQ